MRQHDPRRFRRMVCRDGRSEARLDENGASEMTDDRIMELMSDADFEAGDDSRSFYVLFARKVLEEAESEIEHVTETV